MVAVENLCTGARYGWGGQTGTAVRMPMFCRLFRSEATQDAVSGVLNVFVGWAGV